MITRVDRLYRPLDNPIQGRLLTMLTLQFRGQLGEVFGVLQRVLLDPHTPSTLKNDSSETAARMIAAPPRDYPHTYA
ncbi:hypothetical protein GCM10011575_42680 [Microlunatus endophyticus]|uniref:Uncharacterized protein n=1 Tax=Microlunatus endophyticus TaxID=1716077 RepID=A0A917SFV8_9ACTN|nr:hypothetical protein GCM10011575_42680 [Microlunatus endophyticus]